MKSIEKGHSEEGMPAFDTILSQRKINALAKYVINSIEGEADETFLFTDHNFGSKIQSLDQRFVIDTIVCDMDIIYPWGIAFTPNNEIMITNRNGLLYKFDSQ